MLSALLRPLFVLWGGGGGEKKKESARAGNAFSLFPSSPARFPFFLIIAIFIGIPSATWASAEETATDEWRAQWYCVICSRLHSHSLCRHATLLPSFGFMTSTELMRYIDHRKGIEKSPYGDQSTLTNSFTETKFKIMLFFYFCFWLFKARLIKFTDWMYLFAMNNQLFGNLHCSLTANFCLSQKRKWRTRRTNICVTRTSNRQKFWRKEHFIKVCLFRGGKYFEWVIKSDNNCIRNSHFMKNYADFGRYPLPRSTLHPPRFSQLFRYSAASNNY